MKLADVDAEIERILNEETDRETGEIRADADARLDALELERDRIMLYLARTVLGEDCEADAVEIQAKRLARRVQIHRNRADRLRAFMASRIEPGRKLSDDFAQISWRRSTAVEVDDGAALPDSMQRVTVSPDKKAIGEALKAGAEVPGCRLVERVNMVIR